MLKSIVIALAVVVSIPVASSLCHSTPVGETGGVMKLKQDEDDLKSEARQKFMQGKLDSNKKIVQGLTTTDYDMILEGSKEVTQLVKGQHWFVLQSKEYKQYTEAMKSAAAKLGKAAEDRNMDAAALRYFELTFSCIDCHQYIAKTKY